MNKAAIALTVLGSLALAGCNVTTANSTAPDNVAGDNISTENVPTGTMGEQAAALNGATDENAAMGVGNDQAMSNDMASNDMPANDALPEAGDATTR